MRGNIYEFHRSDPEALHLYLTLPDLPSLLASHISITASQDQP